MAKEETVQERAVREMNERDAMQPTPTQEENDRAKLAVLGEVGSDGDAAKKKASTDKSATYQTREAKAE